MAAGLQCFNTKTGTFQVDGVYKNFVLRRVVQVPTTQNIGFQNVCSEGSTPVAPDEIVALRSSLYCAYVKTSAGSYYFRVLGAVGTSVTCYIFGPITTSNARSGVQVFHEVTGELLFCASKKLLNFAGINTGESTFTFDSARSYAAITLNQHYLLRSNISGVNNNNQILRREISQIQRSMVRAVAGGVQVSFEIEYVKNVPDTGRDTTQYSAEFASTSPALHAIIDVTGYA